MLGLEIELVAGGELNFDKSFMDFNVSKKIDKNSYFIKNILSLTGNFDY